MIRHSGPISGIDAHDRGMVATAGYDDQVLLWEAASRVAVARGRHDHLVNHCAFAPDGRFVVTGSSDYSARIWSTDAMELVALLRGHEDDVDDAVYSSDGERVATASHDGTVRIWDRWGARLAVLRGHTDAVLNVCWSDGDRQLYTCGDDGTVRSWTGRGEQTACFALENVQTDAVVVTNDGIVVAGDDTGSLLVLAGERIQRVAAHRAGVKRLAYDRRARRLVSTSYDRRILIWSLDESLAVTAEYAMPMRVWARACVFSGERLLFGTFGGTYAELDLVSGAWNTDGAEAGPAINGGFADARGALWTVGDAGEIRCDEELVAAADGSLNGVYADDDVALAVGYAGTVIDARTGRVLHRHRSPLNCVVRASLPGRDVVLVGAYTGEILAFDIENGSIRFAEAIRAHENAVKAIAVAEDAIVSLCADGTVCWREIAALREGIPMGRGHEGVANGVAAVIGFRETTFATVGRDRRLVLWRRTGRTVHQTPHTHSVKALATSDGIVATGGYDGTVAFFDVAAERWIGRVRPTTAGISALVTRTRGTFAALSYDGGIYALDPVRTAALL